MGHDYHGIVNSEARRLFETSIDKSKIPDRNLELQKRRAQLSEKYEESKLDRVMAIEQQKLEKNIQKIVNNLYQDFIDNFASWKDKARHEIAVNKDRKSTRLNSSHD